MLHDLLTARRAAGIIALFTVVITAGGGILEWLVDHQEYPTLGKGMWLALQTVTTVGYGDVTPNARRPVHRDRRHAVRDRLLAVITASVTATLVEGSRRRFTAESESDDTRRLTDRRRLARIEAALDQPSAERSRCHQLTRRPDRGRDER